MQHRPLRALLSLLLMLSLISMMPARAAMIMPSGAQSGTHHMQVSHDSVHMVKGMSLEHAASYSGSEGHHDKQCHCVTHCGMCCVCYSAVSVQPLTDFSAACTVPAEPQPLHLIEVTLSIDPRPPRA